jgi:valyl-tRNA synthetase
MQDLESKYNPSAIEKKWYRFWKEKGLFKPSDAEKSYTIVIPPPNITGAIHMGHALNMTLQDVLVRYKRLKGFSTLWLPGEDHAGIATQNAVEKSLAKENKNRHELGREKFVDITWEWANHFRKRIKQQIEVMGCSCDWSRERFTLDEGLESAVRKAFVMLYKKGLIYKGKYIVNWCSRCGTVLSDEEVEHEDVPSAFWYIKYPFADDRERYVTIATTRPETMLGDTAVAVNPSDERYKNLIGKEVILPLVNKKIKIIGDIHADPEMGTGALKVTPAHDPNDFLIGLRHDLDVVEIMDGDGKINENGGVYAGLDRFEARKKIVEDLKDKGYLIKIEEMTHSVGKCYRCGTLIEPSLSDQWFVKVKPLASEAIKAVENGEVKFHPDRWTKVYLRWMNEIRDWCISRQLWWGHRIPVWYCQECGEVICEEHDPDFCPKCGSKNLKQDEDVLDTWFSSQLWPFSTLGWPEKTDDLEKFYPTSTLVTGFDIIFFWVARMTMAGYEFMGERPFDDVYITQLVRDKDGRKMSKSLGNGIDPIEVVEEYGADPMRFTLVRLTHGNDINLDVKFIEANKKFANKIWNATRFVLMNLQDYKKIDIDEKDLELEDRWIISRLGDTVSEVENSLDNFEFNLAATKIYSFFWNEFCDWYIESIKGRLRNQNKTKLVAQNVLVKILDGSLKILHPFMPFVTEELWQKLPVQGESIMTQKWPELEDFPGDKEAEKDFGRLMEIIKGIRNVRAEMSIPPSKSIEIYYIGTELDENYLNILKLLGNVSKISKKDEKISGSATAYADEIQMFYIFLGEMDLEAEVGRLEEKKTKFLKEIKMFEKKLSNEKFIERAPEEVVNENKEKLQKNRDDLLRIEKIIQDLKS